MTKEKTRSLSEFADERSRSIHVENEAIARTNRVLRSELEAEREKVVAATLARDDAEKALTLYQKDYKDKPTWLRPSKSKSGDSGTLVAVLSDTHYGEVTRPEEMNGYNAYNLAIAEKRTEQFFAKTVRLARDYFAGVKYDGIVLAIGGDLVSGTIHDELQQTNEKSTYDTVVWAVPRLVAGIEMWAKEFGRVHVVSVPGNHGREDKRPRYKGRAAHNADTHLSNLLPMLLAKSGDVTFEIPESLDATFNVYDLTFGLEHGDELSKNFSGSAEIGWIGPLIRGTNRKINAYAAEDRKLDYCVWCHGHQLIPIPARGAIGNGSLCGYNEFARGKKFRPEPPQQALMVVDPKNGITLQAPILVCDRANEKWG